MEEEDPQQEEQEQEKEEQEEQKQEEEKNKKKGKDSASTIRTSSAARVINSHMIYNRHTRVRGRQQIFRILHFCFDFQPHELRV
jgi:hypothetical protein